MKQRIQTVLISGARPPRIVTVCQQKSSSIQTGLRKALAKSLRSPIAGVMPRLAAMEDRA
jgi:hypothetical protein